jgi:GNAT superfamily N-acetyltransferase/DNA-binding MarR family transcriptional regulator
MKYLDNLGFLGFGTKLKLLADKIMQQAGNVYKECGIDFEARWFTTFNLIATSREPITISEIANQLSMTHPAIIKITNALINQNLIVSQTGKTDKRKRILSVSKEGYMLCKRLEPVWRAFSLATRELFEDSGIDLLSVIANVDNALTDKTLTTRVVQQYKRIQADRIVIIEFNSELKPYFKLLNIEWLKDYFEVEDRDNEILSNPEQEILAKNGQIYFATVEDEIVGTGAIYQLEPSIFMISKMAVAKSAQNQGVGKKILGSLIDFAKSRNGKEVVLLTDEKLQSAMKLYHKFGFMISTGIEKVSPNYSRAKDAIFMKKKI